MATNMLTLIPRISEKTYAQSKKRVYTFVVPKDANRSEIAQAVAQQYGVNVIDVNIVIAKGKVKQTVRKGRPVEGKRRDIKKAYVTLAEGSSIKLFEEEQ